jgi:hypothetical protein
MTFRKEAACDRLHFGVETTAGGLAKHRRATNDNQAPSQLTDRLFFIPGLRRATS